MFKAKFQKCSAVSLLSVPTENFRFQVACRGFVCAMEERAFPLGITCAEYLQLKTNNKKNAATSLED